MLPEHPTPFELQRAKLASFATSNPDASATAAACMRALHHRQGWDDLDGEEAGGLAGVGCAQSLAQWMQARGHDAHAAPAHDYQVDDILWWQTPDEGYPRFVICRGEQPGARVAYWDPMTGQARWHHLNEGAPGTGAEDHRVRIKTPVPPPPPMRLRTGWKAWLLGV